MRRFFHGFEEWTGGVLLTLLCLITLTGVITRAVGIPAAWAEEAGRYLFVWLSFTGAALALKKEAHFAVDLLPARLPPVAAARLRIFCSLLMLLFCLILLVYGTLMTWAVRHVQTPALELSRAVPYAAVPYGGLLMLIRSLQILRRQWRERQPAGPTEGARP